MSDGERPIEPTPTDKNCPPVWIPAWMMQPGCISQAIKIVVGLVVIGAGISWGNGAVRQLGQIPEIAPWLYMGILVLAVILIFYGVSLILQCQNKTPPT